MTFSESLNVAMLDLAEDPRTVFVGQSVRYDGTAIFESLRGVPMEKRIEMPVGEEFQMGFCIGLALNGNVPICIYPRFDFMLIAVNQLVHHLDRIPEFGWHPLVIIRVLGQKTSVAQYAQFIEFMLRTVRVHEVRTPEQVLEVYAAAIRSTQSCLVVENPS